MSESCCRFGEQLVGIVTEPDAPGSPAAPGPATATPASGFASGLGLVLISAGLLPKAGPYRLYAELARRLAARGLVTLRFDLGGIGDSPTGDGSRLLKERTELEIRAAVDHFTERYGLDRVVLGGLCSGAEDSFRYAARDRRVAGVVMIDPFGYRTPGWAWRNLAHRVTRRSLRALGLYEPPGSSPKQARPGSEGRRLVSYRYMTHIESSDILRSLIDREAHVHFIYTGGMLQVFNHASQLRSMFDGIDFKQSVRLDHLPHMDHTPVLAEDRATLIDAIEARLLEAFPAGIMERQAAAE
jgi:pimeloyl-ACP methyl ester carboxylesterase